MHFCESFIQLFQSKSISIEGCFENHSQLITDLRIKKRGKVQRKYKEEKRGIDSALLDAEVSKKYPE